MCAARGDSSLLPAILKFFCIAIWARRIARPASTMATFFREAVRAEAEQLNTLTFTVTFQAVNTLIESNDRSAPLLMVAVAAIVLVGVALRPIVTNPAAATLVTTATRVATQFLSNLVAIAARQIFFEVATVWWILAFSAFAVLLVDSANRR